MDQREDRLLAPRGIGEAAVAARQLGGSSRLAPSVPAADPVLAEHVLPTAPAPSSHSCCWRLADRASGICWYQPCISLDPLRRIGERCGTGAARAPCSAWKSSHIACSLLRGIAPCAVAARPMRRIGGGSLAERDLARRISRMRFASISANSRPGRRIVGCRVMRRPIENSCRVLAAVSLARGRDSAYNRTRRRGTSAAQLNAESAMDDEFYRIKRLPPYVIAEVNGMRAAARAGGRDIIDLGMGNPDLPPPQHVIDKLCEVAMQARRARLFAVQGHSRPAQGAGQLLRPPLRGRSRSRERGRGDDGLEGRARQPRHRDHRAGRRRAGAQPQLPDPHLRLHHRRGDDPLGADHARRGLFRAALERAMAFTVPRPIDPGRQLSRRTRPPRRSTSRSTNGWSRWAKENKVWIISDLAYSELYYDGNPTVSILQVPGAKDVAVEFTSLSQDLLDGRLADRLRGRQPAADRGDDAGEELPRLRRLHPDPGGRLRRAQRPAGHRREEPRALPQAPRRAGRGVRPRRVGHSAAARLDVRLGAAAAGAAGTWAASNSPSSC